MARTRRSYGPVTIPEDFTIGNLRTVDTYQFVNNLTWSKAAHSLRFGTNMRFQRHTDIRGSVGGVNVAPVVNFSTDHQHGGPGDLRHSRHHQHAVRPAEPAVAHQLPARARGEHHAGVRAAGQHVRARRHGVQLRRRLPGAGLLRAGHLEAALEPDVRHGAALRGQALAEQPRQPGRTAEPEPRRRPGAEQHAPLEPGGPVRHGLEQLGASLGFAWDPATTAAASSAATTGWPTTA
jgi:hypothetical protein